MDKKKVILDTNFLIIPGTLMVDIFTELERIMSVPYELCYIDKTIDELKKLSVFGKEKERFAAKLAIVLIRQKSLKSLPSSKEERSVDDSIVRYANKDSYVATQDKALKERVVEKEAKIVVLRQKKYLVVI
jgi:rRNA-processing protein FCF1